MPDDQADFHMATESPQGPGLLLGPSGNPNPASAGVDILDGDVNPVNIPTKDNSVDHNDSKELGRS